MCASRRQGHSELHWRYGREAHNKINSGRLSMYMRPGVKWLTMIFLSHKPRCDERRRGLLVVRGTMCVKKDRIVTILLLHYELVYEVQKRARINCIFVVGSCNCLQRDEGLRENSKSPVTLYMYIWALMQCPARQPPTIGTSTHWLPTLRYLGT